MVEREDLDKLRGEEGEEVAVRIKEEMKKGHVIVLFERKNDPEEFEEKDMEFCLIGEGLKDMRLDIPGTMMMRGESPFAICCTTKSELTSAMQKVGLVPIYMNRAFVHSSLTGSLVDRMRSSRLEKEEVTIN